MKKFFIGINAPILLLLAVGFVWQLRISYDLMDKNKSFEEANAALAQQIENSRKVYIYSLEDVLIKVNAIETKQKFEEDIVKLNQELKEAEEKINSIKKAQVKADFSDLYLNNIRLKRDELINNYQKSLDGLTEKVNKALVEIAKEKDVSAIFLKSAIAATSPYVIDVTDEVVERIKK